MCRTSRFHKESLEAPPGFEPGMEVLQIRRVLYLDDSSCSLVSGVPRFSLVFGRSWTEVGLKSYN